MDNDRVKGIIDEVDGSAKQKVGEMIGDSPLKVKGIVQQAKGNLENARGKAKDAVREANKEASVQHETQVHGDGNESK